MARSRKSAGIPLSQVQPGDAFLMTLEDGRFGVCRVLRRNEDSSAVLVAASPWVGTEPPDLAEPQLRSILRLTHHAWDGQLQMHWAVTPVPPTFRLLGSLPPTSDESRNQADLGSGQWIHCPIQVLMQWRWDHEYEKVRAEEEAERRQQAEGREARRRAYKPLPAQTLEDFRLQTPFANWSGYVESNPLRAARRIIREAIDALIELGPDSPIPARIDVFRLTVERFNDLDDEDHFIDSIEREHICELLGNLAALVDLDDYRDALTSYRDW